MTLVIRTFLSEDVDVLCEAFANWPKPRELFVDYAHRFAAGKLDLVVAEVDGHTTGFFIIVWESPYRPFVAEGIPEICDFSVLPYARRQGVGTALMDEAELRVGRRSDRVGLGVGLYVDYGSAQRLYARRGYIPDGAGVVLGGVSITPGSMVRLDDRPVLMLTKQLR